MNTSTTETLKYKIGDRVTYTNEFGVVFEGYKITGFFKPELDKGLDARMYDRGCRYFLDWTAHWMPVQESSLSVPTNQIEGDLHD